MTDTAGAINVIDKSTSGPFEDVKNQDISKSQNGSSPIERVINTIIYILGFVAVIAIILAGVRYTTSNGDASKTKQAKDTIMYAVIGLIVAIMAWGIVSFVVNIF